MFTTFKKVPDYKIYNYAAELYMDILLHNSYIFNGKTPGSFNLNTIFDAEEIVPILSMNHLNKDKPIFRIDINHLEQGSGPNPLVEHTQEKINYPLFIFSFKGLILIQYSPTQFYHGKKMGRLRLDELTEQEKETGIIYLGFFNGKLYKITEPLEAPESIQKFDEAAKNFGSNCKQALHNWRKNMENKNSFQQEIIRTAMQKHMGVDPLAPDDEEVHNVTVKNVVSVATTIADSVQQPLLDALDEKQAVIDSLMLEYCPDEMTVEQIKNYAKHQVLSGERGLLCGDFQPLYDKHRLLVLKSIGLTPDHLAPLKDLRDITALLASKHNSD